MPPTISYCFSAYITLCFFYHIPSLVYCFFNVMHGIIHLYRLLKTSTFYCFKIVLRKPHSIHGILSTASSGILCTAHCWNWYINAKNLINVFYQIGLIKRWTFLVIFYDLIFDSKFFKFLIFFGLKLIKIHDYPIN